jgi:hypothetical protein
MTKGIAFPSLLCPTAEVVNYVFWLENLEHEQQNDQGYQWKSHLPVCLRQCGTDGGEVVLAIPRLNGALGPRCIRRILRTPSQQWSNRG